MPHFALQLRVQRSRRSHIVIYIFAYSTFLRVTSSLGLTYLRPNGHFPPSFRLRLVRPSPIRPYALPPYQTFVPESNSASPPLSHRRPEVQMQSSASVPGARLSGKADGCVCVRVCVRVRVCCAESGGSPENQTEILRVIQISPPRAPERRSGRTQLPRTQSQPRTAHGARPRAS